MTNEPGGIIKLVTELADKRQAALADGATLTIMAD
jgi:hypothetical protein